MARSKGHAPRTARDNPAQKLPAAAAENAGGDTEMQGHVFEPFVQASRALDRSQAGSASASRWSNAWSKWSTEATGSGDHREWNRPVPFESNQSLLNTGPGVNVYAVTWSIGCASVDLRDIRGGAMSPGSGGVVGISADRSMIQRRRYRFDLATAPSVVLRMSARSAWFGSWSCRTATRHRLPIGSSARRG